MTAAAHDSAGAGEGVGESRPLVSVVTVSLDASAHIGEALDSVRAQPFERYEHVVIDGGSTDGTLEVLRERSDVPDSRLRWVSEPDAGLYDAMNKGLRLARGDFVLFLGADDRLAADALPAVAPVLEAEPRPDVVCGATRVFGRGRGWDEAPGHVVRRGLPARAPARHQSILVRREMALDAGGFDERYRIAADYDLYLRLVGSGARVVLTDVMLSEFRLGGVSSRDAWATARDYRDVRVAHGANPFVERVVMVKSALAAELFALSRGPDEGGPDDA